jgi:hypothetical protein
MDKLDVKGKGGKKDEPAEKSVSARRAVLKNSSKSFSCVTDDRPDLIASVVCEKEGKLARQSCESSSFQPRSAVVSLRTSRPRRYCGLEGLGSHLSGVRKPLRLLRPPVDDGLSESRLVNPLLLYTILALRTSVRPVLDVQGGSADGLAGCERRKMEVDCRLA